MSPDGYTSVVMDSSVLAPASRLEQLGPRHQQAATTQASPAPQHSTPGAFQPYTKHSGAHEPMTDNLSSLVGRLDQSGTGIDVPGSHDPQNTQYSSDTVKSYDADSLTHLVPKDTATARGVTELSRDSDDDEVDIITSVMKPGASAQPLVTSIRQELERLAHKSDSQAPGLLYSARS